LIAFLAAWLSALAAPDFDVLLVRPSDMTSDALAAALEDVCFSGALRCARALAFAVFEFLDVVLSRIVVDAFVAASFPVYFFINHLGAPQVAASEFGWMGGITQPTAFAVYELGWLGHHQRHLEGTSKATLEATPQVLP